MKFTPLPPPKGGPPPLRKGRKTAYKTFLPLAKGEYPALTFLGLGVGVILLDQILKALAPSTGFPHIPGTLYHPLLALAAATVAWWGLTRHPSVGLSFIVGGGLSNLVDLWVRKHVVDIFVVKNLAFNLADVFILLGFLFIAVNYFQGRKYKA